MIENYGIFYNSVNGDEKEYTLENNKIKVAGYAKRIFFNDNIEYSDEHKRINSVISYSVNNTLLIVASNVYILSLFESLKFVMENVLKEKKTHH